MTVVSRYAWHNGALVEREVGAPSVASISFHLGTGVFDGLMAYWNSGHYYLHKMEEHLCRFKAATERLGLFHQWTVQDLARGIDFLLGAEPRGDQYVRPIAYRKAPELWVTGSEGRPVDITIFTVRKTRNSNGAISCAWSSVERISSKAIPRQTKVSGSYVNSFYCRRTAEHDGYNDGIMLDRRGFISEASAANIFFISGGRLLTPNLGTDTFPGLTRATIMEIATRKGIDIEECDLRIEDVKEIEGAFLCSTLMEVCAISRLETRRLATEASPVYREVVNEFRRITNQ